MKRNSRHLAIAAAALAALIAVAAPTAAAKTKTYPSQLTAAAQNKNIAEGKVTSPNSRCLANRVVTINSASSVFVGTATTDSTGAWRTGNLNFTPGTYTASITKKVISKKKHRKKVCGPATASFSA